MSRGPKSYTSLADFEREEIRPHTKMGWSLDDLYSECTFEFAEDDPFRRKQTQELDFDI
jgi:hypothetical protein